MRVPRTLYLYVSREILAYGGIAFLAITSVLVGQNLLRRLDDLVVVGFNAADLSTVASLLFGMLVAYATPMAFLFGVALATSRLSADSEVLAMRANGLGLLPLLAPALALALLVAGLTGYLMIEVEPRAQRSLRTILKSVATRGGILEPGEFRDVLGRVIFIEARDADNRLEGVLISDRSNLDRPFLIFAERGSFRFDEEAAVIRFTLQNGDVHMEPTGPTADRVVDDRYRRIAFEEFDYEVDVSSIVSGETSQFRPREMSNGELRESIARLRAGEDMLNLREKDPLEYELQLQRRYALPLAPLLFALVAVPLSLRGLQSARSWGALQSVTLVFAYYALLSFAQYLAREGWTSAIGALWAPNGVLLVVGTVLLVRASRRVAS